MRVRCAHQAVLGILLVCQFSVCLGSETADPNDGSKYLNAVREFVKATVHFDPFPPEVYYFTEIPAHVGVLTPLVTAGGAILCSLLFSIIPALRAARMDPIETLHHE